VCAVLALIVLSPGFSCLDPGPSRTASEPVADGNRPPPLDIDDLILPIKGLTAGDIVDTFYQVRSGGYPHKASDILAPRGTPVRAVCDGLIRKLFLSKAGGNTIYEFDVTETYCYYYAHLDRYAEGLREMEPVRQGQVIGYVGTTGNAPPDAPHLHFAILRLGPEKEWWKGTAINPYPVLQQIAAARQ
jgi:peptidoglycan LD-endopeptidase LytH